MKTDDASNVVKSAKDATGQFSREHDLLNTLYFCTAAYMRHRKTSLARHFSACTPRIGLTTKTSTVM